MILMTKTKTLWWSTTLNFPSLERFPNLRLRSFYTAKSWVKFWTRFFPDLTRMIFIIKHLSETVCLTIGGVSFRRSWSLTSMSVRSISAKTAKRRMAGPITASSNSPSFFYSVTPRYWRTYPFFQSMGITTMLDYRKRNNLPRVRDKWGLSCLQLPWFNSLRLKFWTWWKVFRRPLCRSWYLCH